MTPVDRMELYFTPLETWRASNADHIRLTRGSACVAELVNGTT
jgi:hypothetical protein